LQTAVLRLLTLLARYIAITSGRISVIAPANLHETRKISERPQMNRTKNGGSCKRSAKRSLCCRQWIGSWVGLLVGPYLSLCDGLGWGCGSTDNSDLPSRAKTGLQSTQFNCMYRRHTESGVRYLKSAICRNSEAVTQAAERRLGRHVTAMVLSRCGGCCRSQWCWY